METAEMRKLLDLLGHLLVRDHLNYKGLNRESIIEVYQLVVLMYNDELARKAAAQ